MTKKHSGSRIPSVASHRTDQDAIGSRQRQSKRDEVI